MRIVLKLLPFFLLAGGLAFTALELKKIAGLADGMSAGKKTPAEALSELARADKTGAVSKLVEAQQAQLVRLNAAAALGEAPAEPEAAPRPVVARAPAAPAARRGPMVVVDTNSGPAVKASRAGAGGALKRGGAVIVDQATGERLEIASTRPVPSEASLKARKAASAVKTGLSALQAPRLLSDSGDLESRKRRAYGVLLGAVLGAAMLLLFIRRALNS